MTMAPALPGVCGDAKRVVDELHKRNYSVMAEITARIGGFGLLASVLHAASSASVQKLACGGLGADIRADERRTLLLDRVQERFACRKGVKGHACILRDAAQKNGAITPSQRKCRTPTSCGAAQ